MLVAGVVGLAILPADTSFVAVGAIYLFGWLVGFVVPGAPGGIGVREAVFIILLAPLVGEANALTYSIAVRLVTIGGDILFYLAGLGLRKEKINAQTSTE